MRAFYITLADKLEKHFRVDARYFLGGGLWLTLSQGVTIFFGIITTALFAHFLTEANYGLYKYLIGVAVLLSSLSLTGLGQSILQTAAKKYYGFYQLTLRTNFIYSLPITAISLATGGYYYFNENMTLAIGCFLIAILQPLINTFRFIPVFLMGSRRFKESTTLQAMRVFVVTLISLITLYLTENIVLLFATYLAGQLLTNFASHVFFRPSTRTVPSEISITYLNYAKHTSLRNIVANVSNRADTVLVFTQLGSVELAIYTIATVIPEQIKGSFKNLASLLLPKYAQQTDIVLLKKSVPKRSLQLFLILTGVTVVYILAAPYIYTLLFPKYPEAVLLSQLAAVSFPTLIFHIPYSILQSQLQESALYKLILSTSLFQIISLITMMTFFGLVGAVFAKILYRIVFLLISYLYLYKIQKTTAN
jgi:O-antigen/teichoic acid export membrane protein